MTKFKTWLLIAVVILAIGGAYLIGRNAAGLPEKTIQFSISVNVSGNYTITITPQDVVCTKGDVLTFAIAAQPTSGFDADIQLTIGGLPAGSYDLSRVVLTSATGYTGSLTVRTAGFESNSTYTCSLVAKDI